MKCSPTFVLLVVGATVLVECEAYLSEAAIKKTMQMLKNVCMKKHPVEESVLQNMKIGVIPDDNINLKCYFGCVFKTMQMISLNGTIEKKTFGDRMEMLLPPIMMEILKPAIEECSGKNEGEICQNTYNFVKCSYHVDPKFDRLPFMTDLVYYYDTNNEIIKSNNGNASV